MGLIAIVLYRKASEPSGAAGPKTSGRISVALQQTPSLLHDLSRRCALTSYFGEKRETPTKAIWEDLQ